MNRNEYEAKRKSLMDEAKGLMDEEKMEEANAAMKKVEALDAEYEKQAKAQANYNALAGVTISAPAVAASAANPVNLTGKATTEGDLLDSDEYKRAFMAYVIKKTPMPEKFTNANAVTKTSDAGVAIPTTTIQKIYETMENIGMILPLVTRTSYAGGVSVPTSSVKPTASWVSEGATSDKQKKTIGSITFGYYKLRCAVAMTYEVANMAYPFFEAQFVQNVADAMVKAKETAIIGGNGTGKPKGILKETAAEAISLAKGKKLTYETLVAAEGAEIDEAAVWCMTKKTFYGQVIGMVDTNGQPIARVNVGLDGKPEHTILGRKVVLANPAYMDTYSDAPASDSIFAFLYNFGDYILNSGVAMTVKQYEDNDTDDTVIKAIEICDGKSVLNDSLVTITAKAT